MMSINDAIDVRLTSTPVAYLPPPWFAAGGAEAVFMGRTRRDLHEEHGDLVRLSYHAYESMAHRELTRLAKEWYLECDALFVRIHHAICEVPVGEASVLIQVVSRHRQMAFHACELLIHWLKYDVPIWKQEVWADGAKTWSQGHQVTEPDGLSGKEEHDVTPAQGRES